MSERIPKKATGDASFWQQVMDLLDLLLDGSDAASVLSKEPDESIRDEANRLWQHHQFAAKEEFLQQAIAFEVVPVFKANDVLLDRFEVKRLLGRGGMGEVYLAYDRRLGETVAIKTIARLLTPSAWIRRHFMSEVRSARRVTHMNVCRIHDLYEADEVVFFAMEFVEGTSLAELLRDARVDKAKAREIAKQLAEGLQAAHTNGVIHGDFKPGNVFVVPREPPRAVIMDFGLSRIFGANAPEGGDARDERAGCLEYMAPELRAGGEPSVASDIFAFGKVMQLLWPGQKLWQECTKDDPNERPASLAPAIRLFRPSGTRRILLGGALAATGSMIAYYWGTNGVRRPQIESGARILVNGFHALAESIPVARVTRSLMMTALQQSPRLNLIADQDLLPALRRLRSNGQLPVENDVLRQLLKLHRAEYWMDGVLRENNGRPSLSMRLLRTSDESLVTEAQFRDVPSVQALATEAAEWTRKLAGESPQSLALNPSSVSSYSTQVPEALQKYYEAMDHYAYGEMEAAIPPLEEALRLDPNFAQAHNALSMCLNSQYRHVEALRESDLAMSLATKLPDREKVWIEAFHQELVEDPVKMIEATRRNWGYHPDEPRYCRILGQALCWVGRASEAIPYLEKAVRLAPQNDLLRTELIIGLCEAGEYEAALRIFDDARARPGSMSYLNIGGGLACLGLGRYREAERLYGRLPADESLFLPGAKIMNGDLDSTITLLKQDLAKARVDHLEVTEHRVHQMLCGTYYLADRPDLARAEVKAMMPLPEVPAFAMHLQYTAFWASRLGLDEVLEGVVAQLGRIAATWPNGYTEAIAAHARALTAWRGGRLAEAEALLLTSVGSAFTVWPLFDLADLYGSTERWDLAEEYWKKFEGRHGSVLKHWFTGTVLLGWLHRGVAARERGDQETASLCAKRILNPWSGRNSALRIVRSAKLISQYPQRS
jgi:serine/threonine protein kinase